MTLTVVSFALFFTLLVLGVTFSTTILTGLGKFLITTNVRKVNQKIGLQERRVTLGNGLTTWYMERPDRGTRDGPALVVLPGGTLDMALMGAGLRKLFRALPDRRIIVVELPYHGRNTSTDLDFSKQGESIRSMTDHLENLLVSIGLDESFDLLGYSLGGGIAAHYVASRPERVNRLLLLAPYFYETACDAFNERFDALDWRSIHGWETLEEMKHFFHHWLGLQPGDAPPGFLLRGIHGLRVDAYPKGYWSRFFEAARDSNAASNTFLRDRAGDLARFVRPTLVLTAADDTVCDAVKLARLGTIFNSEWCRVSAVPCGHFFGVGGATLMDIANTEMVNFLSP